MDTRTRQVRGTAATTTGAANKQRTVMGNLQQQQQPVVRTTRAQELRQRSIAQQKQATTQQEPVAKKTKEEEHETDESMEVSLDDAAKQALQEQISANTAEDKGSDYLVGHYVESIYEYLRFLEYKFRIPTRYLDGHGEVNAKMRSILVDWLVQVHKRFKLEHDTLHLTIGILDRYLSTCGAIKKNEMQLIGITSLMIACKSEEILFPDMEDYVYICDNAYKSEQILSMELDIFQTLEFNIGQPMSISFLRRFSGAGGVDARQHALSKYLLELALVDYDLMAFMPSIVAAGALNLSIKLIGGEEWSDLLTHYSQYSNSDLKHVVNHLARALYQIEYTKRGQKFSAVKKKYTQPKFYEISNAPEIAANKELLVGMARDAAK